MNITEVSDVSIILQLMSGRLSYIRFDGRLFLKAKLTMKYYLFSWE